MSLVHSAKFNGHDPYAYIKAVLEQLPTPPASRIEELLPHRCLPVAATVAAPLTRAPPGMLATKLVSAKEVASSSASAGAR